MLVLHCPQPLLLFSTQFPVLSVKDLISLLKKYCRAQAQIISISALVLKMYLNLHHCICIHFSFAVLGHECSSPHALLFPLLHGLTSSSSFVIDLQVPMDFLPVTFFSILYFPLATLLRISLLPSQDLVSVPLYSHSPGPF